MHTLTIHDYSNSHPMKLIEGFYSSASNFTTGKDAGHELKRVRNPIGIREGQAEVNKYLALGKDLWEFSRVLPTWMKGRSIVKPTILSAMVDGLGFILAPFELKKSQTVSLHLPVQISLSGTRHNEVACRNIQKNGINSNII